MDIVSCSLGKDSTAMLITMIERGMNIDRVLFADVGEDAEFEETYEFIGKVEKTLGITIERVKSEQWTWDSIFFSKTSRGRNKGKIRAFPPVSIRGCRHKDWLKIQPLTKAHGSHNTIYIGIAADEAARAKMKMYEDGKNQYRFPLIEWGLTEPECREICERHGLLHPLYRYFRRLGCWQCSKQSLDSLRSLYKYWPEKWKKLQMYQDHTMMAFRPGWRVEDLARRFEAENVRAG